MSDRYSKVIGYFAYASPTEIVCTGEACVISGSQHAMRDYIAEIDPEEWKKNTVRKTRLGEIKEQKSKCFRFFTVQLKNLYRDRDVMLPVQLEFGVKP